MLTTLADDLSSQNTLREAEIAPRESVGWGKLKNINIDAAKIHIITDIILSVGVLISAGVIFTFTEPDEWTAWQLFDPLCTYLFSFMAIYATIPITKEACLLLLDGL